MSGYPTPPALQRQLVAPRRPSLRREAALIGGLAARRRIEQLEKQVQRLRVGPHG